MNTIKVKKLIDKDINLNSRNNKKLIINELSRDGKGFLCFLSNIDEVYFKYLEEELPEIILRVYSKSFMNDFKKIFNIESNNTLNINNNILLEINNEVND